MRAWIHCCHDRLFHAFVPASAQTCRISEGLFMYRHLLHAQSKGYQVARVTTGWPVMVRVGMTFNHACHLLTETGCLLTLLEKDRCGPTNLIVPGLSSAMPLIYSGQLASLTKYALTIEPRVLKINLQEATVWPQPVPPGLPLADDKTCHERVLQAIQTATRRKESGLIYLLDGVVEGSAAIIEDQGNTHLADTMTEVGQRRFREAVCHLFTSLQQRNLASAYVWAQRLIGLGPGLTPSGDDFLTGLLVTLNWASPAAGAELDWISPFGRQVVELSHGQTTAVSQHQLRFAAHGEADEVTLKAVVEMLWGECGESASVEALLEVGHSSGADTLSGICVAMELLTET
jgi:hypothetical protein